MELSAGGQGDAEVVLVNMPTTSLNRPSLALGILQSRLERADISCRSWYGNLHWAATVGIDDYRMLASLHANLVAEWVFADAAFGGMRDAESGYLADVAASARSSRLGHDALVQKLRLLSDRAVEFVERAADEILAMGSAIVGCTSVFQQHTASLALLKAIKVRDASVVTMLGGANCESIMGRATHRCFDWVDYVVSGEADELFVPLVRQVLRGAADPLPDAVFVPGHRIVGYPSSERSSDGVPREVVADLSDSVVPDFHDWFADVEKTGLRAAIDPILPVEGSRGCWWGERHHCTFCGLNGGGMTYRTKPAAVLEAELDELHARHGVSSFEAADNILEPAYFESLLPRLAERGAPYSLFWETKANLTRAQVALLSDAGVRDIQPGIESLDTRVLRLLDKGVKAVQNVRLLKWCREHGVAPHWSWLTHVLGDEDEWYAAIARWLPLLEHLPPPMGVSPVLYHRFSVYFEQAAELGLDLAAIDAYRAIYPVGARDRFDLAYQFEDRDRAADFRFGVPVGHPGFDALAQVCGRWRRAWSGAAPELSMSVADDRVLITDSRSIAVDRIVELRGIDRSLYLACEEPKRRAGFVPELAERLDLSVAEVDARLDDLGRRHLVLELESFVVALAVRDVPRPIEPRIPVVAAMARSALSSR